MGDYLEMDRLQTFGGDFMEWSVCSDSASQTVSLGRVFGKLLPAGSTVSLEGGLGSGKTCFIKGVCSGLGVSGEVLSPSFILVEEYRGDLPVMHFDLYRLEKMEDVYQTGMFDAADGRNILLVEWGDRLPPGVFDFDITVIIEIVNKNERNLTFKAPDNFIISFSEGADAE